VPYCVGKIYRQERGFDIETIETHRFWNCDVKTVAHRVDLYD
jgi:hypothetical protein